MENQEINRAALVVRIFHNPYTAWVILGASLLLTILAWWISTSFSERIARDRFKFRVREIASAIGNRLLSYEQALWGSVGLFNASDSVSRSDWKAYVAALRINERLPGIQGIGFAVPVASDQKQQHIESVRAEGFPDYQIIPDGVRDQYSAIVYLEPFDWRNKRAFGYDMWSNETRREAMSRAIDTGEAATSGMITLVQETDENIQKGFLTYLPVYRRGAPLPSVSERRSAFAGWVYSPFRAGDLMRGVLGSEDKEYKFEIYDGKGTSPKRLLYSSSSEKLAVGVSPEGSLTATEPLLLQGRSWTLKVYSTNYLDGGRQSDLPRFIAVGGLLIDVLLFYVIWSIYSLNKQARRIAHGMTSQLEEKTQRLADANQELRQFAYAATHDIKAPVNNIGNALELLEKEGSLTSDRSRQALDWIKGGHARATEILDKLIEVVHIKEGGKLEPELVDVGVVACRVADDFGGELAKCGGLIDVAECNGALLIPETVLVGILENLISNAIKYRSPDRSLIVTLRFQSGRTASQLTVEDNGLGFDPIADRQKVLGLFRRAHDHVPGSGFGLYMTNQLAGLYDASLDFTSEVGKGSSFSVTFQSRSD